MRDISEYKLLGNYLVKLYQKYGVDSIKYENAQSLTKSVFSNSLGVNYNLLPMESKVKIIQNMINKGVFRTNLGNRILPFKQVYKFEVSNGINATYSCDKSLTFKIFESVDKDKNHAVQILESLYCKDVGLDIQKEIDRAISNYKIQSKGKTR